MSRKTAELGVSFAESLRRVVERALGRSRSKREASAVFGLGSSDGSDIARDKDAMLR